MYDYIISIDDLMKGSGHTIALDTETTGLSWSNDKLIGVGIYCKDPYILGYVPALDDDDREAIKETVKTLEKSTTIIFHNAKFDMHFLDMNPRKGGWTIMDTTVMVHLLDSRNKKALKDAEKAFLGTDSKREHVDAAPARTKIWNWPIKITSSYCSNDCLVTYQLAELLYPRLVEDYLDKLFWKDMNYLKVIYDIEEHGVVLNEDFVWNSVGKLEKSLALMEQELFDACGTTFNWRSTQQLSRAIYDGLGIAKPKNPFADADGVDRSRFADSGKYKSTCTSTFLLTEKVHHPLGELISSMREAAKLRKSLIKYTELQDANHILHANFNITGTRTGRLSCSKPNLQNVASQTRGRFTQSVYTGSVERTDEFNMRRAILPRPGHIFISVDYKQMEMRMFGILSKDPFMLDALIAGKDVHLEIALKVWGDCGYDLNMVHREWSKTITFGLIYGMTLGSLQYKLNMTRMQAAKVTDQYWGEFPRIKPWMNEIIEMCKASGYLRYWSGRVWREDNPLDTYRGCNALIQGGCADFLSIATIRVDEWCRQQPDHHLINLVHDETITEVPLSDIFNSSKALSVIMQCPDLFGIPFATEVKVGISYGEMIKVSKSILEDPNRTSLTVEEITAFDKIDKDSHHAKDEPVFEEEEEDEDVEMEEV